METDGAGVEQTQSLIFTHCTRQTNEPKRLINNKDNPVQVRTCENNKHNSFQSGKLRQVIEVKRKKNPSTHSAQSCRAPATGPADSCDRCSPLDQYCTTSPATPLTSKGNNSGAPSLVGRCRRQAETSARSVSQLATRTWRRIC
ncbi:hypothetical protein CBL_11416 [Carabus blaptoides fortunei]